MRAELLSSRAGVMGLIGSRSSSPDPPDSCNRWTKKKILILCSVYVFSTCQRYLFAWL